MTLLEARKKVLASIASELNNEYAALCGKLSAVSTASGAVRLINRAVSDIDDVARYIQCEAERINRESVQEAASEVTALWQGDGR